MTTGPGAPSVFPVFVGCGRSGTTLFRNIFDAHPDLAVTHEAHFIAPVLRDRGRFEGPEGFDVAGFASSLASDANYRRQGLDHEVVIADLNEKGPKTTADAVRIVFSRYAAVNGKRLYGDKTPGSVNHIALIGWQLPETRFVHIIRDGRAVALSYLERPEWGPRTIGEAANHWRSRVSRGREGGELVGPGRYIEVSYEGLVADPEPVIREVCGFLDLDYEPAMLRYHETGRQFIAATKDPEAFKNLVRPVTRDIRDWREQMGMGDVTLFEAIAGDWLVKLGYDLVGGSPGVATRVRSLMAGVSWQRKRVMSRVTRIAPGGRQVESVER